MNIKNKEIKFVVDGKELGGFAVHPKRDCPHIQQNMIDSLKLLLSEKKELVHSSSCLECQDQSENWYCLECTNVYCSREVKGHMANHNTQTSHKIVVSFSDGSFWCYDCDSYIITTNLEEMQRLFSKIKFPAEQSKKDEPKEKEENKEKKVEESKPEEKKVDEPQKSIEKNETLEDAFGKLKVSEDQKFSYKTLIEGIKSKKYNRIVFLTGAGISVSAGIPDFRTPGTGLYSKLKEYNLPYPEAVFELSYFKKNPQAFYTLSKGFLTAKIKPTTSHFFQKMIYDMGTLLQSFTQNIDSLEMEADVPLDSICQAHGHMRTCHCVKCGGENDIKEMMENIEKETIYKCQKENCNGLVKPDIVFFGEKLPYDFFLKSQILKNTDLVIVMGTSLVVFPFASLITMIPKEVPIVLINREESIKGNDSYLFIGGDLDENVEKMVKDLGMKEQYDKIKNEVLAKYKKQE